MPGLEEATSEVFSKNKRRRSGGSQGEEPFEPPHMHRFKGVGYSNDAYLNTSLTMLKLH